MDTEKEHIRVEWKGLRNFLVQSGLFANVQSRWPGMRYPGEFLEELVLELSISKCSGLAITPCALPTPNLPMTRHHERNTFFVFGKVGIRGRNDKHILRTAFDKKAHWRVSVSPRAVRMSPSCVLWSSLGASALCLVSMQKTLTPLNGNISIWCWALTLVTRVGWMSSTKIHSAKDGEGILREENWKSSGTPMFSCGKAVRGIDRVLCEYYTEIK